MKKVVRQEISPEQTTATTFIDGDGKIMKRKLRA
jgi:hypothetical protein